MIQILILRHLISLRAVLTYDALGDKVLQTLGLMQYSFMDSARLCNKKLYLVNLECTNMLVEEFDSKWADIYKQQ